MYVYIYIYNLSGVAARVASEASDAHSPQVLLYMCPRTIQLLVYAALSYLCMRPRPTNTALSLTVAADVGC
jgi:hypothetical protein